MATNKKSEKNQNHNDIYYLFNWNLTRLDYLIYGWALD